MGGSSRGAPEPPAAWGPDAAVALGSHLRARAPAHCPPPENGVTSRPRGWQGLSPQSTTLPTETGAQAPDQTHAGGVGGGGPEPSAGPRGLALLPTRPQRSREPARESKPFGATAPHPRSRQRQPSVQAGESVTDKPGEILIVLLRFEGLRCLTPHSVPQLTGCKAWPLPPGHASQAPWPGGNAQPSRVSGRCLLRAGPGLGLVRAQSLP